MSWQASEAVRVCSKLTQSEKSVAYALATFADERGEGARPSKSTLAEGGGVSIDTVKRALRHMEDLGEVKKTGKHWIDRNKWVWVRSLAPLVGQAIDGGHIAPPPKKTGCKTPETGGKSGKDGGHIAPQTVPIEPSNGMSPTTRAGAREGQESSFPSSNGNGNSEQVRAAREAKRSADLEAIDRELTYWRARPDDSKASGCIANLEEQRQQVDATKYDFTTIVDVVGSDAS